MKKVVLFVLISSLMILFSSCLKSYKSLDKLPQEYSPKLAQKYGDVATFTDKNSNINSFKKFMKKYESNKSSMIRITQYSVEGDAIIHDLIKSKNGVKLIIDNTRDSYTSQANRTVSEYNVVDITKKKWDNGLSYSARLDNGNVIPLIYIKNK